MLDWAGRDDDFEAEEFDVLVDAFSLDLLLAPGACQVLRDDGVTLYRVRRSTPAGAIAESCGNP